MAITALFEVEQMTADQYDEVMRKLEVDGLGAPDGRLHHIGAPRPGGWLVVDVWESPEKFAAFGARLMPILGEMGLRAEPQVGPVHNLVGATR